MEKELSFITENTSEYKKKLSKTERFILSKAHTFEYENLNYVINENTINDIEDYNQNEIKKN